jgi:tetratricopeptide (TPR) repeat protein
VGRGSFLLPVFLVLWALPGFAQNPAERPYWYTLERGKASFRAGEYGTALVAFEEAREQRQALYKRMERDLVNLLSRPDVRLLGDSLDQVEAYIAGEGQRAAAAALAELYYRLPRSSLGGSARTALEQLERLEAYPEAEYWIGETYRAEGELGIALGQYLKAYEHRSLLEAPAFSTEIVYRIVDIHRIRQEYLDMEKWLLVILEQDTRWSADGRDFTKNAMARILENDGITRFLTLYRYNNTLVERAHRLLGLYYYASGRHSRAAEHLLFSFLIQNTVIIEEILRHRPDFRFTGLDGLRSEISRRPALAAYLEEVDYYKTMYYLGSALYAAGKAHPAGEFWRFLAQGAASFAGEWGSRARSQISRPSIEPAVEMP